MGLRRGPAMGGVPLPPELNPRTSPHHGETRYGVACGLYFVCTVLCPTAYSTTHHAEPSSHPLL